jgi:hypothetical protein
LTQSLSRDGQTQPSANLPMNTFRHTNVGDAVARNEYATLGQVQDTAAPIAKAGTGPGQFLAVAPGIGNASVLPGGGTWKYSILQNNSGTGVLTGAAAGIAAGGTTIGAAGAGLVWSGWVERVT